MKKSTPAQFRASRRRRATRTEPPVTWTRPASVPTQIHIREDHGPRPGWRLPCGLGTRRALIRRPPSLTEEERKQLLTTRVQR